MGVVVRRYIDFLILLIPNPLVLRVFSEEFLLLCVFKKCSSLFMLFLCNIANFAQRTFEIIQKSRSCKSSNPSACENNADCYFSSLHYDTIPQTIIAELFMYIRKCYSVRQANVSSK